MNELYILMTLAQDSQAPLGTSDWKIMKGLQSKGLVDKDRNVTSDGQEIISETFKFYQRLVRKR